jgi:hypothetical protein
MGVIDGNKPVTDNDWEAIKGRGDAAIEKWIENQLEGKSCTVVFVGSKTANRKWIRHEIIRSWNLEKGVVGIYIHGLKNSDGELASKGDNPFDHITIGNGGKKLSAVAKCYNPAGTSSKDRYEWISTHLANAVEEAITIRSNV